MVHFPFRDQGRVFSVYRHEDAEAVAEFVDNAFHHIVLLVRGIAGQLFVDFHGRAQAGAFVNVKAYQNVIALFHRSGLLPEWKEEVLFQSPVEEGAVLSGIDHFQNRQFSEGQLRLICRCNETVSGVFI